MPVLVALAEAMADPGYGVEHSGNTPGAETLITINGPIIKDLDFNYEQGVCATAFRPIPRLAAWWRLYLRNVAGFLLHQNDKGTFGNTWRVVLAENEDVLARINWPPLAADFGYARGDNVVTISRYTGGDVIASVFGQRPEDMLPYLADALISQTGWQLILRSAWPTAATARFWCSPRSWPKPWPRPVGRKRMCATGFMKTPAFRRPSSNNILPSSTNLYSGGPLDL